MSLTIATSVVAFSIVILLLVFILLFAQSKLVRSGDVNIIVSDGFTGNIALKTAEGTSNFIISDIFNLTSQFSWICIVILF